MGRTTLARDLIEQIKIGKAKKAEILRHLAAASRGAEKLRRGDPAVTVEFHALRPIEQATVAREVPARGTGYPADATYDLVAQAPLYSLTDAARVDVLRFGRHPDQDVQLLDPMFCDYGTLKDGAHAGSTNGTYVDGTALVRDALVVWLPGKSLMIGHDGRKDRNGVPCFSVKITYTMHARADDPRVN